MFHRHNRVWLSVDGWKRACKTVPPAYVKELMRWAENDWPAIVRRSDPESEKNILCLGLTPPPDQHTGVKIRIPFSVCTEDIVRCGAPLAIISAESVLPLAWHSVFSELSDAATSSRLEFRVYGSAAMQAITGLPYLTASSDIDLLFYPLTNAQLHQGLNLLNLYAKRLPLDGEIVFPSGRAVAWKECAQALENPDRARVLAKSMLRLDLVHVADFLAELENPS